MDYEYEWDEAKRLSNLEKHKLDFSRAADVIESDDSITIDDVKHSLLERRYITIGYVDGILCTVVIHTRRNINIRIISFRPANKKERLKYGKNS